MLLHSIYDTINGIIKSNGMNAAKGRRAHNALINYPFGDERRVKAFCIRNDREKEFTKRY